MITTKQRDDILEILMDADGELTLDGEVIADQMGISPREVMKVVDYLTNRGLIDYLGMAGYLFQATFTMEGDDFYNRGGFEYEETIASAEVNKLMYELESLADKIPSDKYNKIMTTLGVVISALSLAK